MAASPEERAAASAARRAAAIAAAIRFEDGAAFRTWLEAHADTVDDVWIRMAKKHAGIPSVNHSQALDEALCFGWIDAQALSDDDERFTLRRFVTRRPRSTWSQVNRDKVEGLIAAGRMTPRGQAEIDRAHADGRMGAAYQPPSSDDVPAELVAALAAAGPKAEAAFAALRRSDRYSIVHRIATAKKAETKVRNSERYAALLAAGEPPFPPPAGG